MTNLQILITLLITEAIPTEIIQYDCFLLFNRGSNILLRFHDILSITYLIVASDTVLDSSEGQ